jgi:hypothetical protein
MSPVADLHHLVLLGTHIARQAASIQQRLRTHPAITTAGLSWPPPVVITHHPAGPVWLRPGDTTRLRLPQLPTS